MVPWQLTDNRRQVVAMFGYLLILWAYSNMNRNMRLPRRWWVRPINRERIEAGAFANLFQHMKHHDHEMFFKYTRMTPDHFKKLLNKIQHKLRKRSPREALCPELRLAMTIKFLAHGGTFQNLSWEFRVGHCTASKVVAETCAAIWEVLQPEYLRMPQNEEEWKTVAQGFNENWNFPHTLGAIDGKHVTMQCPINTGSDYYNYKHHFSIILLACCDADYKFIWVDIGAQGAENDASVFRRSQVGIDLECGSIDLPNSEALPASDINMEYFFIGDEAFPLKTYIMRPYPGKNLDDTKLIFNYRLSRARRTIENAFGILASRWRVYRAPIYTSTNTCKLIVQATVCLHNYLRTEKNGIPTNLVDKELSDGTVTPGDWRKTTANDKNLRPIGRVGSNVASKVVYNLRDKLATYLTSNAGSVPWQETYIRRGRF